MEASNDRPLVNVYFGLERMQFAAVIVESNNEKCNLEITSPDWESLSGRVTTSAGDYLLTVNDDGAKLEPMTEPSERWYESAA